MPGSYRIASITLRLMVVVTLPLFSVRCTQMGRLDYFHPSRSPRELARDEKACHQYARSVFPNRDGLQEGRAPAAEQLVRTDIKRDAFDDCMTEKGWIRRS